MKVPFRLLAAFFVLLGILSFVIAQLVGASTVIGGALINLGVVFISIIVLDMVWSVLGGEPLQVAIGDLRFEIGKIARLIRVVEDAEHTGVKRIITQSDEFGTGGKWRELLQGAVIQVDLAGTGLHGWLKDGEHFRTIVREGILKGCSYRLLLYAPLRPDSPPIHPIRQIIETENDRSSSTGSHNQESLRFFLSLRDSLPLKNRKQFQIKVLDDKVMYSLISRFDNTIIVTFYMYHQRSESSPLLEIYGPETSLYKSYVIEFELLWSKKARDIELNELTG